MKITRSLSLKNSRNKIVKKLKIIYDIYEQEQQIKIVIFEGGKRISKITSKKYTLEEIEQFILNKIKSGFQVYSTFKEKSISFKDFQKEIKYLFKKPKSPRLKSGNISKKKQKKDSLRSIEKIINSYNKDDLLKEIDLYNGNNKISQKKQKQ